MLMGLEDGEVLFQRLYAQYLCSYHWLVLFLSVLLPILTIVSYQLCLSVDGKTVYSADNDIQRVFFKP